MHASARQMAQAVKVAQCMRAHGVTGFPDPTTKLPANASPANYSALEDRGGVVTAIPKSINPQSPAFQQAAGTCHFS